MRTRRNQVNNRRDNRKWTTEEDQTLLRYVKARPQNLHYCFMAVADQIGRTDKAVAAHWYTTLSKKPQALCFFTASASHLSKNRKNGAGEAAPAGFWRSLMQVLQRFHF